MLRARLLIAGAVMLGSLSIAGIGILVRNAYAAPATQTITTAQTASGTLNNVNQLQLQQCMASGHQNCESQVPGLSQCMSEQLQCNAQARTGTTPTTVSSSSPSSSTVISKSTAVSDSLIDASAFQAKVSSATKTASQQMALSVADSLLGQNLNPSLPRSYPVWVVSVDAQVTNLLGKPGVAPVAHPYFTVVLDGYSGRILEAGLGVDSLNVAGS